MSSKRSTFKVGTTEGKERHHHYAPIFASESFEWCGRIGEPFSDHVSSLDALVVSCEHPAMTRAAIGECKRQGIPTFHVLDGIVEWRNVFENPRSLDPSLGAPLFQPLLSDHTFVMGETQRWVLEWLGNESVEVAGLPRFDHLRGRPCRTGALSDTPRLLVATARTPWFTREQETIFLRQFERLRSGLMNEDPTPTTPAIDVSWRLAPCAAEALGVENQCEGSALDALEEVDALITSPSSLAVEAMILGLPTLILDPFACPPFVPSAWHATSGETALQLLPSLLAPERQRARWQDSLRDLTIRCDGGASDRIRQCILGALRGERPSRESEDRSMPRRRLRAQASEEVMDQRVIELEGLVATIPSLERLIVERQQTIDALHAERARPTMRHALGCVWRSVRRLSGR